MIALALCETQGTVLQIDEEPVIAAIACNLGKQFRPHRALAETERDTALGERRIE